MIGARPGVIAATTGVRALLGGKKKDDDMATPLQSGVRAASVFECLAKPPFIRSRRLLERKPNMT